KWGVGKPNSTWLEPPAPHHRRPERGRVTTSDSTANPPQPRDRLTANRPSPPWRVAHRHPRPPPRGRRREPTSRGKSPRYRSPTGHLTREYHPTHSSPGWAVP